MLTFALAAFFLIVTPGPGVLSLAGVGSAFGRAHGAQYLLGLFVGNNVVCLAVVSGLAAMLIAEPRIRTVFYIASVAYLAYLAFRIAYAGSKLAFIERAQPPGIRGGITLQIINPKAYAVNTAFFSGFAFMPASPTLEVVLKLFVLNAIWIVIHALWLWFGLSVRQLNLSPQRQRAMNVIMAGCMLLVVALAALTPS